MNISTYFKAYNSQIKVGDYIFSYVGGRDAYSIICEVLAINSTRYKLRNVDTNRIIFRNKFSIALLPDFANLPNKLPEAFI